jgi:aldose 1-epimerase
MHEVAGGTRDGYAIRALIGQEGGGRVEFAPDLGMVCCSFLHEGEQLLGLRGGLAAYDQKGSTMGVPLLHPWANRLAGNAYRVGERQVRLDPSSPLLHLDANGLPIHGVLARHLPFQVTAHDASITEARLTATFQSERSPGLAAIFPFPHRIEMEARLASTRLEIATTLTATGDATVPVVFGYHPYLRLPGAARASWSITAPPMTGLALDARMIPTGAREQSPPIAGELADRSFDDAYADVPAGAEFVLAGGGRRITVSFLEGYPFAQVFAPPDQEVVCFEPMTAPANALASGDGLRLLAPGESHRARFAIVVQ